MSKVPEGSIYPDIYFQLSGIKSLGLGDLAPGIGDYDGTWISVSSSYLQSLGSDYGVKGGDNTKQQLTAVDIAELAKAGSSVTQQYRFSTDPDKAVFIKKSFVGKEAMDGLKTYHYKVGVNTEHATAYCVALENAILSTNAAQKLAGGDTQIANAKKTVSQDCANNVKDSFKSGDTYDMWIDGKYKLIHKFRIYDKSDTKSYTDIGQTYVGGDKLSFFANYHGDTDKLDGSFKLDTDVKASKTTATFTVKSTDTDMPYDVTIKLNAEASTKAVPFTKPATSVPIEDILKKLGVDAPAPSAVTAPTPTTPTAPAANTSAQSAALDSQRKIDINELDTHLEAFDAQEGRYPTFAEINDSKWRAANMHGLDASAYHPPNSTTTTFAAKASTTQYGYVASDCGGSDGCQGFTLSALLSTGQVYQKQNF
jgi:hypothetical protein